MKCRSSGAYFFPLPILQRFRSSGACIFVASILQSFRSFGACGRVVGYSSRNQPSPVRDGIFVEPDRKKKRSVTSAFKIPAARQLQLVPGGDQVTARGAIAAEHLVVVKRKMPVHVDFVDNDRADAIILIGATAPRIK